MAFDDARVGEIGFRACNRQAERFDQHFLKLVAVEGGDRPEEDECPRAPPAHRKEQEAGDCIEVKDVADPQEKHVEEPEDQQPEQASAIPRLKARLPLPSLHLQVETKAEQSREDRVRLVSDKPADAPISVIVGAGSRQRRGLGVGNPHARS